MSPRSAAPEPPSILGRAEVPRIVVVGGGIAGLAAAHRLLELAASRRPPIELILVEARDRLGGTITTEQIDGYLIEGGPDSFLTEKPWGLALCDRLGLTERLISTSVTHRRAFIVRSGRLVPLPEGFLLLAPSRLASFWRSPLLSWRGKLRVMMDLVLPKGGAAGDESIAAFVTRRFGREALERVVQPLVTAIYTADPSAVSLEATMPRFAEMERQHGSIIRALRRSRGHGGTPSGSGPRWSLFTVPAGGMQELVSALTGRLPSSSVKLHRRVITIGRSAGPRAWRVNLADGTMLLADAVILAVPPPRASRLVAGLDPGLGRDLSAIPYHSSAIVTLAYRRADIRHRLDGFGFVAPRREGRPILACAFSSLKYAGRAPRGDVLLRAFVGGDQGAGVLDRDDPDLSALVHRDLAALLRISAQPVLTRVHRHVLAMPQYEVGHTDRVAAIQACAARHPALAVCGNAFSGIGIPDCIHSGEVAAERVLAALGGQ